jgi:hypothetical protein
MICPKCQKVVGAREGVVLDGPNVFHGRCYGEPRRYIPPDAAAERMVETVASMLHKQLGPQVAEERSRNIVQWLITEFHVTERTQK